MCVYYRNLFALSSLIIKKQMGAQPCLVRTGSPAPGGSVLFPGDTLRALSSPLVLKPAAGLLQAQD